ncbi:disks large-associated protein 5 [Antennarius striatus]|uniref:disks large-associated protein 5 n=1 Tax=Antennarius striatus TaxID=241820 RepID=UPI0035B44D6C
MESRFAHLRQRDTSVSMLRVKVSRRKSQSQKENRDRAVNTRRRLDKLPELELSSLDASVTMANMSTIQEKTMNKSVIAKIVAAEDRLKQLARWKERKALEKEKEKRQNKHKVVFKTGIYHPKDTFIEVPQFAVSARAKEAKEAHKNIKLSTVPSQSTRVTRSMKQQQQQQPLQQDQRILKMQHPNTVGRKAVPPVEKSTRSRIAPTNPAPPKSKAEVFQDPVVRAVSTRSANKLPATVVPVVKDKPKEKSADVRSTRSKSNTAVLPERERKFKKTLCSTAPPALPEEREMQVPEQKPGTPSPKSCSKEDDLAVDKALVESTAAVDPVDAQSFAPEGFVFQAPDGLSFKFEPLTPRSADAFLTPNISFSLPPVPVFQAESSLSHSLHTTPTVDPLTPASPLVLNHDVPYFRSEIANETDRLTNLCIQWEAKVEDESIPEEMRDRMRTAVGQARLLMKERFKQFSGLVDDCELGRGEKITTCTDLQGFWDMVYYQVEDVNKKFNALKEAESRGWVEEFKPPPRQKKVVKKPSATTVNPSGSKAAAKSRLAAVKAAMKAKQQAAEKTAKDAENDDGTCNNSQEPESAAEPQQTDALVFDGGFFKVESPAKPTGPLRRSSRLSASVLSQTSPCVNYLSPRRVTRRSLALAQTPVHTASPPAQATCTPSQLNLTPAQTLESQHSTPPQLSHHRKDTVNVSLCFSPVQEELSQNILPKEGPECQLDRVAGLNETTTVNSLPSISVVEEQAEASCKTLPVTPAPEILCQSFVSSLLLSPTQLPITSSVEPQESVCLTPGCLDVEDIPGLDIERYLQPSQRCSLSPREAVAEETFSPMAVDVEMKSPGGETEDFLTRQETALPAVSSVLFPQSPQAQTAESALLLFTPDLKDRIRQSVCPSDLMVFTPPS